MACNLLGVIANVSDVRLPNQLHAYLPESSFLLKIVPTNFSISATHFNGNKEPYKIAYEMSDNDTLLRLNNAAKV